MFAIQPLLADIGGLIAVAFMIMSFIGWIANLISKQQQAAQPQPKRPPQNRKVRDEIEKFLQEATGQPKQRSAPPGQEIEILDAEEIEVIAPAPRPRTKSKPGRPQSQQQRSQSPKKSKPQKSSPVAPQRAAPGQQAAQRQVVPAAGLGTSLQQHVQSHMAERMAAQASRDVEPTVDDSVAAHMGAFAADVEIGGRTTAAPAAGDLLKMLRNPQGVRQAYILGEILRPPISRRRRSG
jgi:hypothetical protein